MNRDANSSPSPRSESSPNTPGAYSALAIALFAWDRLARGVSVFYSTLRAKLILSLLGCRYGKHLQVDGKLVIRAPRKGSITLGDNVRVNTRFMANLVGMTNPTVFHCSKDGRISLGDNSGCSATIFSSRTGIHVGRNVNIGGNVRIYDHDFHPLDYRTRRGETGTAGGCKSQPVSIGDDVFIGANVIILKGVSIGDRSVIGAGSVVTLKEIPPDSLVAGNPARIVRSMKPHD